MRNPQSQYIETQLLTFPHASFIFEEEIHNKIGHLKSS